MHSFKDTKNLPYSAIELFNLVLNIESYPEFLPWCQAARLLKNDPDEIIAEIVIYFKGLTEKYQSSIKQEIKEVALDQTTAKIYKINVEAISGPFKYLYNSWQFTQYPNYTEIYFSLDFEFKSSILDKLMGFMFAKATAKMLHAFEERAALKCNPIFKNQR